MEKLFLQNNKLETLGLRSQGSTPATAIPPPLSFLKFLRVLRVDGNKLSNLDGIGSLLSLEELDASHNEIRTLKALRGTSGGGMKNLTSLNLNNNSLSGDLGVSELISDKSNTGGGGGAGSISSASFFAEFLPALKDLNVSRNKLTSLTGLKSSESITLIDASHNAISSPSFMNALGTLPNLLELNVSFNQLSSLPPLPSTPASAFPALEVLDISWNAISSPDTSISDCISSLAVFAKASPNLLELVTLGNPFIRDLQTEIDQGDVLSISSSISEQLCSVLSSLELFNRKAVTGTSSTLATLMSSTDDASVSISSMALPTLSVEKFSLENNAGSTIGAAFAEANSQIEPLRRPGSASKNNIGTTPMLMRPSSAGGIRPGSASIQRPRSNGGSSSSAIPTPAGSGGGGGLHLKSVVSREDIEAQLKSTMESLSRTRKNAAKRSAAAIEAAKGLSGDSASDAANALAGGPRGLRQALKFARDDPSLSSEAANSAASAIGGGGGGNVQNRYLAAAALRKKKTQGLEEEKQEIEGLPMINKLSAPVSQLMNATISTNELNDEVTNHKSSGPASGYGTEEEAKLEDEDDDIDDDGMDDERKETDEVLAEIEAQTVATLTAALNPPVATAPFIAASKPLSTSTSSSSIDSSRPTLKKSSLIAKAPVSLSLSAFSRNITITGGTSATASSLSSTLIPDVTTTASVPSSVDIISETPSELDLSGGSNQSITPPPNPQSENSSVASPIKVVSIIKPSRPLSATGTSKLRVGESLGGLQQRDLLMRQSSSALTVSSKGAAGKMSDESIKRSLAAIQ